METNLAHASERYFDGLAPEPALPTQFQDIWSRTNSTTAEPRLALAVLQLAVVDLLKYHGSTGATERRLYRKAHVWVTSTDRGWPYSYLNLCDAIEVDAYRLRERLLSADAFDRVKALREIGKLLDIGR